MDHDLVTMIYGALIGVGSSIVTTLIQSWISRRERQRQQKEEQRRKLQEIYLPTTNEIQQYAEGKGIAQASGKKAMARVVGEADFFWGVGIIVFIIGAGIVFLLYKIDNPVLYIAVPIAFGFFLTYIITKL